jgi:very-short-patch-repair endonuclease
VLAAFPTGSEGVAHRRELSADGITPGRIQRAIRSGRWQEPVPGVVVAHSGPLTRRQRWLVGLHHAALGGGLSHRSALALAGARVDELPAARRVAGVRGSYADPPEGGLVEVSVPHGRHLRSSGFVVVHQTRRPLGTIQFSGLTATPVARATVDVALTSPRRADVDHVVSNVLQRGLVTVDELVAEVRGLGRLATPWLRAAVADACRGMRSVGESELRRVVVAAGLPEPEWNAEVLTAAGRFFVDALWRKRGVAAEADGALFHLSAEDWSRDLLRQNAIAGVGIRLVRFPVRRLRVAPDDCGAELRPLVA